MFKHVLLYRMRHFFGKWKHTSDKIRLAEQVNVIIFIFYYVRLKAMLY